MATPYDEITGATEDTGDAIPSYMIAANNHNTGNLNTDWFEGAQPQRSLGSRAYNMVGSAALSGINSFYNTAVWAGNMFSDEGAKYRDTREWISSFDENMGQYYDQNREAADLLGFVATSFVPGLGGVKVFNAGAKALTASKEGIFGYNMARGLGVLPGARQTLVKEAVESYATTRTAFTVSNPQTLKAIASGFGEQVLQAAAFETAVAVTMKKSPILTEMDAGDMIANIATGALIGGAIGGAIEGAITVSKIKSAVKGLDTKLAGVTQVARGVEGTKSSDELLIRRNDLDTLSRNAPDGVDPELYAKLWEQKITYIDNADRETFTKLANGNAEVGNRVYEGIRVDGTGAYSAKVLNLQEIATHADNARLTKQYGIGKEVADGEAAEYSVRHFKLWGDDMGKLSDEAPSSLHLADKLAKGQTIEVRAAKVTAGKQAWPVQPGRNWDISTASVDEAMARAIWAMDDTVPKLIAPKTGPLVIGANDIPMLTKAYREGFNEFQMVTNTGDLIPAPVSREALLEHIAITKNSGAIAEMEKSVAAGKPMTAEAVANKYDVPLGFLTGEQYSTTVDDAIFGLAKAQKDYYNKFHANTTNPPAQESVKPWLHQQNYQMVYDLKSVNALDNFQVEAMTVIKQRQILQQETNEIAVTSALKDKSTLLPEFTDAELTRVNRGGAGAGFVSFANASYGTAGSKAEYVGALVTRWVREAEQKVGNTFMTANYQILNTPADSVRLAAVMQKVRSAGSNIYVMDDEGAGLILRSVRDYRRQVAEGVEGATPPIIPNGVDPIIELGSDNVRTWAKQHIALNSERVTSLNNLRGAKGQPSNLDPEAFYPPAPNPQRFKFHAFAVDDAKVTSTGHTSMLYADSAQNLEKQIAEARAQGFNVFTPDDTASYFKARGQYDYTLGLNESQMDAGLRRTGSSAPAFPLTGAPDEMLQDIMQWHAKQEAIVIREAVSTKYSRQFGTLYQMGEEYNKIANARVGFLNKLRGETKNPFEDYVKTFMGASLKKDYPLWTSLNNFVDEAGQKVYNSVANLWKPAPSVQGMIYPKQLKAGQFDHEQVNQIFKDYGMQMAATPAQMEAWVAHPAGQGVVSKFIQSQNAILSSLVLRLDPVNALNNAVGSTILTGAETKAVLRAIQESKPELVGELAELARVTVPGTEDGISSASKLIAGAYKNYFSEGSKELLAKYKTRGYVTDTTDQFKQLLEVSTIQGTETAAELESKKAKMFALANKLVDKGEKWTGNRVAEEMNRFVSANIMDQITSVAVRSGIMDQRTADSYINTFVNRTQGNIVASQRPQMFQGPVGQAVGLFQSYQFNIMQQLLRYVGEGSKKDALTLMGLQGTVYGMNGLPAFQAINQHILGNASGNKDHTDAYKATYGIVGKTAGDWIMYGVASNMLIDPDLKINLYSRGDINPRQLTVVPTNMADIPIVSSWARLTGAIKNSLSSVANGGDVWNSVLSGIEQQGLNRPLAGLARVSRGLGDEGVSYSTSGKGNIVSANDFYSLANLARLSGAKPFDEAVTQDAVYRIQAYQSVDKERREGLGKAVKSVIASGGEPTSEQMEQFIERYAKLGGKQEEFNKWYVAQIRAATTPQANKLVEKVGSPYSSYMQTVMGGRLLATPATVLGPSTAPIAIE